MRDADAFDDSGRRASELGARFPRAAETPSAVAALAQRHWDLPDRWEPIDDEHRGAVLGYRVATSQEDERHFYASLPVGQLVATPAEDRGRLLSFHIAQVAASFADHGSD